MLTTVFQFPFHTIGWPYPITCFCFFGKHTFPLHILLQDYFQLLDQQTIEP